MSQPEKLFTADCAIWDFDFFSVYGKVQVVIAQDSGSVKQLCLTSKETKSIGVSKAFNVDFARLIMSLCECRHNQ